MPLVKAPVTPSPLDYVPPNSEPYKVKEGDTWWSLAELPSVRNSDMSASDLCHFNFRTRKATEINWYLKNKVGCTRTTRSGKNYVFSISDSPGIVYLPKLGKPIPVDEQEKKPETQVWVGLAGKLGEVAVVAGIESVVGVAVSIDHFPRAMWVGASVNRLGVGFGASGGAALMIVGGVKHPRDLNGHMQMDGDFNLAIGVKAGSLIKAATSSAKFKPIINWALKVGAKTPKGFANALLKNPDKVSDVTKIVTNSMSAWGLKKDQPHVVYIDIPFAGGGTEASVFYALSEFRANYTSIE